MIDESLYKVIWCRLMIQNAPISFKAGLCIKNDNNHWILGDSMNLQNKNVSVIKLILSSLFFNKRQLE